MKSLFTITLWSLISCSSGNRPGLKDSEFAQMNQAWKLKPNQQEVIGSFGTHFEKVQEGITYNYDKTPFTKMAFFFGPDNKLIDQYAIVDETMLKDFKKAVSCDWNEKKIEIRKPHVISTVDAGQCLKHKVKYFYREDLAFYEIRWF